MTFARALSWLAIDAPDALEVASFWSLNGRPVLCEADDCEAHALNAFGVQGGRAIAVCGLHEPPLREAFEAFQQRHAERLAIMVTSEGARLEANLDALEKL